MKVNLLSHTPNPEKTIACAAKLCYSNTDIDSLYNGLTDEKTENFLEMLAQIGHESPIEHVSFTFGIEGVSRSLLAQITRHRIASFSVQSQRYVKENHFEFVIPPEIANNKAAAEAFNKSMQDAVCTYNTLCDILEEQHVRAFLNEGLDEKLAKNAAEKKAIEDARFVLPNACVTKMIVTMNARSLQNFFAHRCCNRAQWEIKAVADEMLKLCLEVAPTLFKNAGPKCIKGPCPEGKKSCKKMIEVREFYKKMLIKGVD